MRYFQPGKWIKVDAQSKLLRAHAERTHGLEDPPERLLSNPPGK